MSGEPSDRRRTARGGSVEGGAFENVLEAVEKAATEILDEAELEAERRIQAAEARASRIERERASALSERSEHLLESADSIRERADALLDALESAAGDLAREGSSGRRRAEPVETRNEVETSGAVPADEPPEAAGTDEPEAETNAPPDADTHEVIEAADDGASETIRGIRERLSSLGRAPRPVPLSEPDAGGLSRAGGASPQGRGTGTGRASEGAVLLATQMAVAGASRDQIERRLREDFGIDDPYSILERIRA